jgi:hypothetical protein
LEGYFGTVGYQFDCMARFLPWRPREMGGHALMYALIPALAALKLGCAALSVAFHRLETHFKYVARGHPKNYVVIAGKTGEPYAEPSPGVTGDR